MNGALFDQESEFRAVYHRHSSGNRTLVDPDALAVYVSSVAIQRTGEHCAFYVLLSVLGDNLRVFMN